MDDTWTTKEGVKIPIREMGDGHLLNTIAFIRRQAANPKSGISHMIASESFLAAGAPPECNGDMAQMAADAEWEAIACNEAPEILPVFRALLAEAKRRDLGRITK